MSRWGKPTKNKRARNPRYRLDELEANENDRAMSLAGEFLQMAKAELEHSQRMGGEGNPALIPVIDRLVDMRRGHVLSPEDLLSFIDSPEVEESGLQTDFRAKADIFAAPQRAPSLTPNTDAFVAGMNESKRPLKTIMEGFRKYSLNENVPPEHLISRQDMLPAVIEWLSGLQTEPFRQSREEIVSLMQQVQSGAVEPCKITNIFEEWDKIPKQDKIEFNNGQSGQILSDIYHIGMQWKKHFPKC